MLYQKTRGQKLDGFRARWFAKITTAFLIVTFILPAHIAFAEAEVDASVDSSTDSVSPDQTSSIKQKTIDFSVPTMPKLDLGDVSGDQPLDTKDQDHAADDVLPGDVAETLDANDETTGEPEGEPEGGDIGVTKDIETNSQNVKQLPKTDPSTGALLYSYPIVVPDGRNGLTPNISLVYNSNALNNDSAIGYGWSFDIPYIERVNKYGSDKLYDHWDFTSSLSGELSALSTSSSATSTFSARSDDGSFLDYEFKNNVWIVHDKSGTRYVFGGDTQARLGDPDDAQRVYRWFLEEVRDANDNFISYQYYNDNRFVFPETITYTGHGSSPGLFSIEFDRTEFEMSPRMYFADFLVLVQDRISSIKIKENGEWVRKYDLGIGTSTAHRLLSSITESGRDPETNTVITKDSVVFEYQKAGPITWSADANNLWELPHWFHGGDPTLIQIRDVNGDTYPDVIFSERGNPQSCPSRKATWINDNHGGWLEQCEDWLSPSVISNRGQHTFNDNGLRFFDYDGDQLTDMVYGYSAIAPLGTTAQGELYRNVLNPDSNWNFEGYASVPAFTLGSAHYDGGVEPVDFNGDGLMDFVHGWIDDDGANPPLFQETFAGNGSNWATTTDGWHLPWGIIDENPHGKEVPTFAQFMDVNGDNLPDFLFAHEDGDIGVKAGINIGHDWLEVSPFYVPQPTESDDSLDIGLSDNGSRSFDANGDGVTDFISAYEGNGGQFYDTVYLGTLAVDYTNTFTETSASLPYLFASSNEYTKEMGIADINADGMIDFLKADRSGDVPRYVVAETKLSNGTPFTDLLVGVKSADGSSTTVSYKMSTKYFDGNDQLLNPQLPIAVKTVNTITTNDGLDNLATTTYTYANGSYYFNNPHDRKFAGFGLVTETDSVGNVTKTYFHQGNTSSTTIGEYDDHVSKIGRPYRTEKYDSSGNLYAKTINTWDKANIGGDAYFVKLSDTVSFAYDGDSDHKEKASSFDYNNSNGNLTEKIDWGEVSGSNDGTFSDTGSDTVRTEIAYATSSSISLPSRETVFDHTSNKIREKKTYYDSQTFGIVVKGNPTGEEFWKSGSEYVGVGRTFNEYGLVIEEVDPRENVTTHVYDSYNLYPATTTNALGHQTQFYYDYSAGKPKEVIDPNGYRFVTVFDGLDRVKEEKQPDLSNPSTLVTKAEYEYTDSGSLPRQVHRKQYLSSATSTDSYAYLDGFGRVIQERTEAEPNNTYSVKDISYNSIGKVYRESLPYFSSSTSATSPTNTDSLYVTYLHDPLYRVKEIGNALGTTTNAYDDWKTTITDANGNSKHLYKDARDNLVLVDEINDSNTYTTAYDYDGNNNLTKITDALNNIRNFTYDGLGRLLTSQDLHDTSDTTFGTWTYVYDAAGNVATTTDPKGQVIINTHDSLNRVKTEDYTGLSGTEIQYGYDMCVGGVGKLCTATSSNVVIGNQYNSLGLVSSETKKIAGDTFVTSYTYDRLGNPITVTHPDSSITKHTYNSAGQLESLAWKSPTASVYTPAIIDLNYSPLGQTTFVKYGNNSTTTNTYDATKLYRLTNKTSRFNTTKLQDLEYEYDPVGNVTQIIDTSNTNSAKNTYFSYDDLNRLTVASTTNAATSTNYRETYEYNAIGNITYKSDQGDYYYEGFDYANPHAVTAIEGDLIGYGLTYDNNGNLLTQQTRVNTWDYRNRLTQSATGSGTTTNTYDMFNDRVKRIDGGLTTVYLNKYYDVKGSTLGGVIAHHLYAGDQLLVTIDSSPEEQDPGGGGGTDSMSESEEESGGGMEMLDGGGVIYTHTLHYIHPDHLMGSSVVTNQTGTLEELIDYYPFGDIRFDESTGFKEQRKYTGHVYDEGSDLSYMGARYQNGKTGTFLSQDPVYLDIGMSRENYLILLDPQKLNSYGYAINNPLRYNDPNGESARDVFNGLTNAVLSNNALGAGRMGSSMYNGNQRHYQMGQSVGDLVSMAQGIAEIGAGSTVAAAGGVVTVGSGGLAAVVSVPAIAGGAAIASHGSLVILNGGVGLLASPYSLRSGIAPDGVLPPGNNANDVQLGPASRPSENAKGGQSYWDRNGGEWRYSPEDQWHNPHWDYNPHKSGKLENGKSGNAWQNVPIGDKPVYKPSAKPKGSKGK